ncbi:hypothetical protein AB0425_32230 [Actinosynnema sp. NPDC051121]
MEHATYVLVEPRGDHEHHRGELVGVRGDEPGFGADAFPGPRADGGHESQQRPTKFGARVDRETVEVGEHLDPIRLPFLGERCAGDVLHDDPPQQVSRHVHTFRRTQGCTRRGHRSAEPGKFRGDGARFCLQVGQRELVVAARLAAQFQRFADDVMQIGQYRASRAEVVEKNFQSRRISTTAGMPFGPGGGRYPSGTSGWSTITTDSHRCATPATRIDRPLALVRTVEVLVRRRTVPLARL